MSYFDLNSEERKKYLEYSSTDYSELYNQKEEWELFDIAKTLRKNNDLKETSFNKDDWETYRDFIYTKPKSWSISDMMMYAPQNVKEEMINSQIRNSTTWEILSDAGRNIKEGASKALSWFAWTLDKVDDILIKKWIGWLAVTASIVYSNAKELKDSFIEDRDFDFLKTEKTVMDTKEAVEYAFWTKLEFGDYLDFRTSDEKRKEIIQNKSVAEQQVFKELDNTALMIDISSGILAWVGSSKALTTLARKWGVVGKTAKVLDKTINPSLSNMAKAWALVAWAAIPYYWVTGKWIFDWDSAATQWAMIVMWSLWLKLGWDALWSVLSNREFRKWVQNFYENGKNVLWEKIEDFAASRWVITQFTDNAGKSYTWKERNAIYKDMIELEASQKSFDELWDKSFKFDTPEYTFQWDILKRLKDKWLVVVEWIDKGNVSLRFTDEAWEIRFGANKYNPDKPIKIHYPPDLWKQVTWEDVLAKPKTDIEKVTSDGVSARVTPEETIIDELVANKVAGIKKAKDLNKRTLSERYEDIIKRVVKTWTRRIGEALWDKPAKLTTLRGADRKIQRELEGYEMNGKTEFIKNKLDKVIETLDEREYMEFSEYLFAKSRFEKWKIFKNSTGKELQTIRVDSKWNKVKYTMEDMDKLTKGLDWKYWDLAKKLYKLNDDVLEFEKNMWVRTVEEIENFKNKNPFYMPDKLESEEIEKFVKRKGFKPEAIKLGKPLKWGTLEYEFNHNSVDNLYKQLSYRMYIANRTWKIGVMMKFWEPLWTVKVVEETAKKTADEWIVETFINWEKKLVKMPKMFIEEIDRDDMLSSSIAMRTMSAVTSLVKAQATWVLAPWFQLLAPTYEVLNTGMKAWANWNTSDVFRYFRNIYTAMWGKNANSFINSKEGKEAVEWLMDWYGGNWSHIKLLTNELVWDSYWELKWMTKSSKVWSKAKNWIHFWHNIEKNTSRMPIYSTMLEKFFKEQKLGVKDWQKMLKESWFDKWEAGSIAKLSKALDDIWVSPRQAWTITKQVFNYTVWTKSLRELWRIFPYLSTTIAANTSIKQLLEDSPRKALWLIWGMWMIWDTIASYNSWTTWMFGLLKEDLDKQDKFTNAPTYQTHTVGFLTFGEELDELLPVAKNTNFLRWMFPMIAEAKKSEITWEGINMSESMWTLIKDVSYMVDLNNELFPWVNTSSLVPHWIKQVIEVATNTDLFFGSPITKDFEKYPLQDKQWASKLAIKTANIIAKMSWWEMNEVGLMEWGVQFSPKAVDRMFKIGDPQNKITSLISDAISRIETWKADEATSRNMYNLFNRVYKSSWTATSSIYDKRNENKEYNTIVNTTIRDAVQKAKTVEELEKIYKQQIDRFSSLSKDEQDKKKKLIKQETKLKIIEINYDKELATMTRLLSWEKMAEFLFTKHWIWDNLANRVQDLYNARNDWLISKQKVANFNKRLNELLK